MMKKFTFHTMASMSIALPSMMPAPRYPAAMRDKSGTAAAASATDSARWMTTPSADANDHFTAAGQKLATTCCATTAPSTLPEPL
jgi:hypothetical protein